LYAVVSVLGLSLDEVMRAGEPGTPPSEATSDVASDESGAGQKDGSKSAAIAWIQDQSWTAPNGGASNARPGGLPNLQKSENRATVSLGGVQWERLTPDDDPHVDFLLIRYAPGSESCSEDDLQRHSGWEYGHVVRVTSCRVVYGSR